MAQSIWLSRRFLSGMIPGLGDVYFLQRDFVGSSGSSAKSRPKGDAHWMSRKALPGYRQKVSSAPAGGDAPRAALPPPVNRFELDVEWPSFTRAVDWANPERTETAVLVVHPRLSSILAAILSQG